MTDKNALGKDNALVHRTEQRVREEMQREALCELFSCQSTDVLDHVHKLIAQRDAHAARIEELTKDWALVDETMQALKWHRMVAGNKPRGEVLVWYSASPHSELQPEIAYFAYATDAFGTEYLESVISRCHLEPTMVHVWAEIPKPGPDAGVTDYKE